MVDQKQRLHKQLAALAETPPEHFSRQQYLLRAGFFGGAAVLAWLCFAVAIAYGGFFYWGFGAGYAPLIVAFLITPIEYQWLSRLTKIDATGVGALLLLLVFLIALPFAIPAMSLLDLRQGWSRVKT